MIDSSGTLADTNDATVRSARVGTSSLTFTNTHATATIRLMLGAAATATTGIPVGPGMGHKFTRGEDGPAIDGVLHAISDTSGATYQIVET